MWQDYAGIVPGVAAAVMGIVTMATQEMRRWQKVMIVTLTMIAIGATGFGQWWSLHVRKAEAARRTAITETLGSLIDEGQKLQNEIVSSPTEPLKKDKITDWMQRTANFLRTLGYSFVVRFMSDAGLETNLAPDRLSRGSEQNLYWHSLRNRLSRLHEFSAEYSGQVPRP